MSDWREAILVASVCAFLVSSPFLMCVRHGQTSVLVSLCVLGAFLPFPIWGRSILLGFGAVLKYSMLPLLAPALFFRGGVAVCVAGFVLFAVMGLSPLLFGHDLVELYRRYLGELGSQTGSGFNTFAVSGYNMLQLDFLASPPLRLAAKLAVLAASASAVWLAFRRGGGGFGLHLLLLLSSATMLLSYHRVYDMVLPLALLLAAGNGFLRSGRYGHAAIAGAILGVWIVPETVVYKIGSVIGGLTGGGVAQLSSFRGVEHIFPVYPCVAIALTCYALWLCVMERETHTLPAPCGGSTERG